jgi:hypothetical protein
VTDITDGVVGVLSTFRVDASKAGEGQLEISINDGDVPNQVQVRLFIFSYLKHFQTAVF